jgi:hypothetical protein
VFFHANRKIFGHLLLDVDHYCTWGVDGEKAGAAIVAQGPIKNFQ